MNENNKIPRPYKTPDGYFENFGDRLKQRMEQAEKGNSGLTVTHRKSMWWAAAASVALIAGMVSVYFLMKSDDRKPEIAKPVKTVSPIPVPEENQSDTAAEAVLADIEAEAITEKTAVAATQNAPVGNLSQEELMLEEAGLIVCDVNDGLFNPFNIGDE